MSNIILLAESGADIPRDLLEKYNIATVPMHVSFGEETRDDMSFPPEEVSEFYKRTGILPKTSGSSPGDFHKVLDHLHQKYPNSHILHLAYSAVTTCSYQSAIIASENRDYITSIDTKQVSAGQAMIVLGVADFLAKHPGATLEGALEKTKELIRRVKMAFVPGDLDYLRAGGRVSNAAYMGAKLLNIKPVIEILDGKLTSTKKYRGKMEHVAPKLIRNITAQYNLSRELLFFVHSHGLAESVKELMKSTAAELGFRQIAWIPTGCVITTHGGPGAFGMIGLAGS